MERTEIASKLQSIFRTVLKNDSLVLTDELTAADVDDWDSLTHMELIHVTESAFEIRFKLKDLNKMKKIGDWVDVILEKVNG